MLALTPVTLELHILPLAFAVCRLAPDAPLPAWATSGELWSLTRTQDELSILCVAEAVPAGVRAEGPWRALRVAGTLDFALVGIIHSLAAPLAAAAVSIFVFSTFDTDYMLVRAEQLDAATRALRAAGHTVLAA